MTDGPASLLDGLRPLPIRVHLDPPLEVTYASFVCAGLRQLAEWRLIEGFTIGRLGRPHRGELELGPDGWTLTGGRPRYTTFASVERADRAHRVAFDHRDSATTLAADALDPEVTVWKRSFVPAVADAAKDSYGVTVRPGGLSLRVGARLAADRHAILAAMLLTGGAGAVRADRGTLRRLRTAYDDAMKAWRAWPAQWDIDDLRARQATAGEPLVVFQTRSFGVQEDTHEETLALHQQRAAIIRSLRSELGPRFRGGFVADPMTTVRYADCLTDIDADRRSYGEAIASASVVVSSRGLYGSIPHKIPEYHAFGKCIVHEATDQILPGPFALTFAPYGSVDDCVGQAVRLLADADARAELAQAAHRYYREWVDPPVAMHRMLSAVIGPPG